MHREAEPDFVPDETSDDFAVIGNYRSARKAHEAGLSVLAAGHHYWVRVNEGRFLLIVPGKHAELLRNEVAIATIRNRYWPPRSLDLPLRTTSMLPTAVFVVFLVIVFALQNRSPDLEILGANNSHSVLQLGEWWRIVTAITLHADLGHLAGNILGMSLFGHLCCRYMGNGLAWLLILVTAALSNLTNVFLNAGQDYVSLGASTAVFSALGLLAGFPIGSFIRSRDPILTRDWLIPFFGGCVLFAWMGGGNFPTDVAGHLWSFGYGLVASIIVASTALHGKLKAGHQRALLLLAATAVGAGWLRALAV